MSEINTDSSIGKKESASGLFVVIPAEDGCFEHKKGNGIINLGLNGGYLPGLRQSDEVIPAEKPDKRRGQGKVNLGPRGKHSSDLRQSDEAEVNDPREALATTISGKAVFGKPYEVLARTPYAEVIAKRRRRGEVAISINRVDPHSGIRTDMLSSETAHTISFEGEESLASEEIRGKVVELLSSNGLTRFELAVMAAITRSKLDFTQKNTLYFYAKQ